MSEGRPTRAPRVTINKVYTRHGDAGETGLVGGQRVPKDTPRIQCYGTVDELNALVGAARVSCLAAGLADLAADLLRAQHALFNLGSLLATRPEDLHPRQPRIGASDVSGLEARIDHYNATLPTLRSFVLPGSDRANADLHLARTVCRRAERLCVRLARTEEVDDLVVPYLNRLSDALFVFSRYATVRAGHAEVLWTPDQA